MNISANSFNGNKNRNDNGNDLGKIEDIMINATTGEVSYTVLSVGGFVGISDKYFAAPLHVMRLGTENEGFVLNESKERLENAPGFDKDKWPSHSDEPWFAGVKKYYKI